MTARFHSALVLKKLEERTWSLAADLVFESARYKGIVIAPAGAQTNLASIPRIAWTIFPPIGWYDLGAVIHDCGYSNMLVTQHGDRIFTVKEVADNLFYEAMIASGVNRFVARMMYAAVKVGGNPEGHPLAENAKQRYEGDVVLLPSYVLP